MANLAIVHRPTGLFHSLGTVNSWTAQDYAAQTWFTHEKAEDEVERLMDANAPCCRSDFEIVELAQ